MPGLISSVQQFDRTSRLPDDVWNILRANAARANLILPHAEKVFNIQKFVPGIDSNEQLWLVYTKPGTSSITFILSSTEGAMGKYPVFIVPTIPLSELTPELLEDSVEAFCDALLNEPGFQKQRVFSIFSVDVVAEAFARAWKKLAGIEQEKERYYDAIFTRCSSDTFIPAVTTEDGAIERHAVTQDAPKIATMCHDFAATSPPFLLSHEKAAKEAELMIANEQVWVLEMRDSDGELDVATIVAVTRKSSDVAAITKVFTPAKWGRRGCAERLVRHVCKELLQTYKTIVLYVGVDNPARRVYARVGFKGLTEGSPLDDEVEHWVEIGFDQAKVDLGHW
ncbi:hypothetical protein AZE42_02827 [Rhizopogon vesiculosus]|uniref:N-acetyltransferase domain-containing protein n=1 Tax=Rhizopogon vesiculosus TaxID=180088 RepID=A0A1J8QID1_9AGAM|nr:hypothetical protein AZE42_02827 [Rhizopogon vesiculosus]